MEPEEIAFLGLEIENLVYIESDIALQISCSGVWLNTSEQTTLKPCCSIKP